MSVVRLKCPACASVVRIAAETAAAHPVVRCAKCQGLVNVATSRLADGPASPASAVPAIAIPVAAARTIERQPAESMAARTKPRPASSYDPRVAAVITVGVVLLALVGVGAYFLVTSLTESPHEREARKTLEVLTRVVEAYDSIQTAADVPAAVSKMKQGMEEMLALKKELGDSSPSSPEEKQQVFQKYWPKFQEAITRIQAINLRLAAKEDVLEAFAREMGDVNLKGLGGGFGNLGPFPGGIGPNRDRAARARSQAPGRDSDPPTAPEAGINSKPRPLDAFDIEFAMTTRTALLRSMVEQLKIITDGSGADVLSLLLENMLAALANAEKDLKEAERQGKRGGAEAEEAYAKEMAELKRDLTKEYDRITQIPGISRHLAKLRQWMQREGLVMATASNDAPRSPTPRSEEKNPFEEAGRGEMKSPPETARAVKPEEKNPFEPAKPGKGEDKNPFENARPGKPDEKNPFEPAKPGETTKGMNERPSPAVEAAVEKMQSTDLFRRQDGVREVMALKPEDASKKTVLDALVNILQESDPHTRGDAFKAFKKWASTKEDRELLGKAMEGLLADPFVKKDVIKYASDHKIVSAATELAKLLKDVFDRMEAARALISIGPPAEPAAVAHLTDLEPQVRQLAIEVLAQIGTKECVPELQKLQNDRFVGLAAKQAVRRILIRHKDK